MGSLEEIKDKNIKQFHRKLDEPVDIFMAWLEDVGLLKSQINCPNCQNIMTIQGRNFVCNRRACREDNKKPKQSQFSGTIAKAQPTNITYS